MLAMLPRWASSVFGTELWAWVSAIGSELNRAAFFIRWSFLCWTLQYADVQLLNHHGLVRGLPRYPLDTDESYRIRLLSAWTFYKRLGTSQSIRDSFHWLGFEVQVICPKDNPGDTWDGPGAAYDMALYDVDVYDTADTWDRPAETWDEVGLSDQIWNSFWVKIFDYTFTGESWDSEDGSWDSEDGSWDSEGLTELQIFTDIILRCRAAYNLFSGYIFVSPEGVETTLTLNLE